MQPRILIFDDDANTRKLLSVNLHHAGFAVIEAEEAEQAWQLLVESPPNAVVIDWMLPGMTGFSLLRQIRAESRFRNLPLLMLTARSDSVDKVTALSAGADDYMTKPFSPKELNARLRALMRSQQREVEPGFVEMAGLRLVPETWTASARGSHIPLGPTEFRLLHFLMCNADRIFSRAQLIERVWGRSASIEERTVDVHIRRLRSALSDHAVDTHLQTVYGVGYRFSEQRAD